MQKMDADESFECGTKKLTLESFGNVSYKHFGVNVLLQNQLVCRDANEDNPLTKGDSGSGVTFQGKLVGIVRGTSTGTSVIVTPIFNLIVELKISEAKDVHRTMKIDSMNLI